MRKFLGFVLGILWRDHSIDFNENVTVIGVVKKGNTGPLMVRTVYYIEAEKIESLR